MTHSLKDLNRTNITLTTSKVGEVLPEYLSEENPKLITFLEKYLEYLDSDTDVGFGYKIKQLINARDASQTTTDALDQLVNEIGNGIKSSTFFAYPRLMVKLLGDFYRAKGSLNSAEGFFKGFFGVDAEIEYPKQKLFTVGESQIGYESQKFLVNAGIYQTFSILVKCGISTSDYESLYKRFVHPAGFHFAGEVLAVNESVFTISAAQHNPLEDDSINYTLTAEGALTPSVVSLPVTALWDSSYGVGSRNLYMVGDAYRIRTDQFISNFSPDSTTLTNWGTFYSSIAEISHPNSFTFDDSTPTNRPDTSMTFETMDNEIFTTYTSDSAY